MNDHRLQKMEVPDFIRDEVNAAIQARGWCIGGYAQVEFIMADFATRMIAVPGYEDLAAPFPYSFSRRVARVREIADRPGILSPYADRLRIVTDKIESWEQRRHFLTHGWMEVRVVSGTREVGFEMRRFTPTPEDDRAVSRLAFKLHEIQKAGDDLTALAEEALKMFDDIYAEFGLEKGR